MSLFGQNGADDVMLEPVRDPHCLTPLELEILQCLADDMSISEIARKRGRAYNTIVIQVRSARSKLNCNTCEAAVATAIRQSLID